MYGVLLTIHILVCLGLIAVVLLQSGKGGGLASGAFGGTAQTVLGGRGATDFITRATMVLGGAFFVMSLLLALLSSGTSGPGRSLLQEEARRSSATSAPAPNRPPLSQAAPSQASPGQAPAPGTQPVAGPGQKPATTPAPAPGQKPASPPAGGP
ncbi:MAG TPA: preprotein translocase subunit SecG [Candidatus Eisenbacteria bacterium]